MDVVFQIVIVLVGRIAIFGQVRQRSRRALAVLLLGGWFLLPKIQAFYQPEEGQRLFGEWKNRRNAEEKTGKCQGS